jgi:beta-lactamase superfamily II metal-dependent hydrolase
MTSLTILDVGHGNAAVLRGPDATVLVDAGPGRSALLDYLLDEDISAVDAVVISHADEDHLRGLLAVLDSDSVSIDDVCVNTNAIKATDLWDDVTWSLNQLHRAGELNYRLALHEGDPLPRVAGDIELQVLAPDRNLGGHGAGWRDPQGRTATTNTLTVVLRLVVGGRPEVLLTGDIDEMGLAYLVGGLSDVNAERLVFPHHGGHVRPGATEAVNRAFASALFAAVRPRTVVFSLGRGVHGTPRPEIVAEARNIVGDGVRIACTQLSKRCRAGAEPPASAFTHLLPLSAAGAEKRLCCAGTLRLVLGEDLGPDAQEHEMFKSEEAPTALCRPDVAIATTGLARGVSA